ncbi:hypothetical protein [Paraburkholderia flagellata]|uniref:hypothetical protein n=1 Tax=Paraburkholderia flagellata TaxID=2883241 RepID=UPI001F276440|nr:hypothetical protein [Paraburkholderia flagellata]
MDISEHARSTNLLSDEQKAHIHYVRDVLTIQYEYFLNRYDEVMDYISGEEPGLLLVAIGPTHVGKSKLLKYSADVLAEKARQGGLPAYGSAYARIPSPNAGKFDHIETCWRLLEGIEEPLIEDTVEYNDDPRAGAVDKKQVKGAKRKPTHSAILRRLVKGINAGEHGAVFLDEAGEIPLLLKNRAPMQAAMSIKEVADLVKKPAVLAGGPEIAPLLWMNAQLKARLRPVWVAPFNPQIKEDAIQYASVLRDISKELGNDYIREDVLTIGNCHYMMRQLWGILGLGTKITLRAITESLRHSEVLEWGYLKRMIDEAHVGMRTLVKIEMAMFYAAQDEDRRSEYWAQAAYVNMTPENFYKGKEPGIVDAPDVDFEKLANKGGKGKSNDRPKAGRRKGMARPAVPERPLSKNLPGEGAAR